MPPSKKPNADVSEMVTRHDERITTILKSMEEKSMQNRSMADDIVDLKNQVADIKHTLAVMDKKLQSIDGVWARIFDYVWKLALAIIGGFILYMLNLQSPPLE